MATPAERIDLAADGVAVTTRAGTVRAGAAILTVSTAVLAGDALHLPPGTEPWREAAAALPLGRNEKVFLEIGRDTAFEPNAHAYGNLYDPRSAAYTIRPNGWPIIEAFLGGDGARLLEDEGPVAGFAYVSAELVTLFGNDVASAIRPLAATSWSRMASIGGAYSCALPGQSQARARLAQPFDDRLFFAGEGRVRDRALFDLAVDSKLRGCDLVKLKIGDVVSGGRVRSRAIVVQRKTGRPVQFELLEPARTSILAWLECRGGTLDDYAFPSRIDHGAHISTRQYARLVDEWVAGIGLRREDYGTHSLRRTKASLIYKRTGNLRAVQILLGHTKIESTVRYLGVDVEDALVLAEGTEI